VVEAAGLVPAEAAVAVIPVAGADTANGKDRKIVFK